MPTNRDEHDINPRLHQRPPTGQVVDPLVTVETQRETDLLSGERAERTFVKLYVAARESGLLAAISDRDWKTLCTLATYMDGDGYCHPSQAELARAMGCSRQMANERIRSLAAFRFGGQRVLLVVKEDRTTKGEWARNGYRVLPISKLRIYDSPQTSGRTDTGNDTEDGAGTTVSSMLDTGANGEPTVSSPTVTVRLDTNKNQQKQDLDLSRFEGSHDGVDAPGSRRPDRMPARADASDRSDRRAGEGTGAPVPLGEILRRRAEATRGADSSGNGSAAGTEVEQAPPRRRSRTAGTGEERERLRAFLEDFARELGDEAPLSSTITRALNIFRAAGVPPERWGDYLYQARGRTQEHTAQITKRAGGDGPGLRQKNKMPYLFATLEQLVGLRPEPARQPARTEQPG